MKQALISPQENVYDLVDHSIVLGVRVCEVRDNTFPVCPPLFWVGCDDNLVAENSYYKDGDFFEIDFPEPVLIKSADSNTSPNSAPMVL